jgi:hypothetical protein
VSVILATHVLRETDCPSPPAVPIAPKHKRAAV